MAVSVTYRERIYAGLGLLVLFALIAFAIVWVFIVASDARQKHLQAFGIDGFNDVQLRVWRECESVNRALDAAYKTIQDVESPDEYTDARWDRVQDAATPQVCVTLRRMAAEHYRERVEREQKVSHAD